jgi:hypothetical protein
MPTQAENQANVKFSYKKYYSFRNKINRKFSERFRSDMRIDFVTRTLFYGDTQPAVVVSTNPLLIAAYSDEMDAVVMLRFPEEFAEQYDLSVGSRLTTSNVYFTGNKVADDIHVGANYSRQYVDFVPIVQLFLGKKDEKITEKTKLFKEDIWQAVTEKAQDYLKSSPDCSRDGFFYFK